MPNSHSSGCLEHALPYPADSTELYRRIRHLPLPVFLTSGQNQALSGRYDVITAAPEKILSTRGKCTTVVAHDGSRSSYEEDPFQILKREFEASSQGLAKEALPPMFPGGAMGYLRPARVVVST
jgi:para-aminobenzoate synthetase component 1